MNDIHRRANHNSDISSEKMKNPRVWIYIFLAVLFIVGVGTWLWSDYKEDNTSNSLSSSSNTSPLVQQKRNANPGSDGSVSSDSGAVQK
ncbi:hypothetical protein [Nitrosomonas supralitoralis]|uniref:Uncharacterized protein n=1 Tax=Nitrosomonas supralitoralis TaxID=2116706 RepID=A0A2P7NTZ9_9PROT|nr:hypothetical protein [Nitrosomonas supralitoralis]PSJ16908.1 hypothetical protein C7H79_11130 [Nitrosomonas supralitoralis]